MKSPLHQITTQLKAPAADVRAEVVLAQLLEGGLLPETVQVKHLGQARRPVRADIDAAQVEPATDDRERLVLYLNRDGMYDTLPEGVFHETTGSGKKLSAQEMIADYRGHQQEEQDARLFFAPLEQECFLQRTFTEQQLQQALERIQHALPDDELFILLGIDPALPVFFRSTLLHLLSHIPAITGNVSLTARVFSLLLGQPVSIRRQLFPCTIRHSLQRALKGTVLGGDFVLGHSTTSMQYRYQLQVGPVNTGQLLDFFPGHTGARCLQTLLHFFIPVTWDIAVKIIADTSAPAGFVLDRQHPATGRLGYNIVLGKANATVNG